MNKLKWIAVGLLSFAVMVKGSGFIQDASTIQEPGITVEAASIQIAPLSLTPADLQAFTSLSEAQVTALISALDATPTIPAAAVPKSATLWSLAHPTWPPLPGDIHGLPVWPMAEGNAYLLNDVGFNYTPQTKPTVARRTMSLAPPGFDGSGTNGSGTNSYSLSSYTVIDYGTNLWIAQVAVTNGYLAGIGSNTLADVQYEIQSRTNLLQSDWLSEGFILGSEITNWTPLSVAQGSRTNLFIRLRSSIDSANVGIPDWWQLQYFGYVGINPYATSPSGDGFSIWHKYQNGLNPTNFETPLAPNNFVAVLSTNGTDVLLSWNAAQGSVANYSIVRGNFNYTNYVYDYSPIATVSASATSFLHVGAIQNSSDQNDIYDLTAGYQGGNTSEMTYSYIYDTAPGPSAPPAPVYNIFVTATLVRNATGRWQLMFAGLPSNVQTIRLYWNSATQDISPSVLTNGIYSIPDTDAVNYLGDTVSVQGLGVNEEPGQVAQAGVLPNDAPYFVDGRQHLKQNLAFMIRGASDSQTFWAQIRAFRDFVFGGVGFFYDPYAPAMNQSSTNFEQVSFLHHGSFDGNEDLSGYTLDNLWPFTINCDLANYFVDTTRTNSIPFGSTNFTFSPNFATNIPAPAMLTHADPYWILQPGFYANISNPGLDTGGNWNVSVTSTQTVASLASSGNNLFGLPYQTGCEVDMNSPLFSPFSVNCLYQSLPPGGSVTASSGYNIGDYANWCPAPALQLVNYYAVVLANPNVNPMGLPGAYNNFLNNSIPNNRGVQPLTPLEDDFNVTNQTPPLMIGAVGEPMIIGAWAKYSISNSSPTKYAYLGQYFTTNVFLLDGSGSITTNSAGVLSPYGEFFPTQGGQTRLVTMPDIDTGMQGTCTVSIVSLNVDANHDGTMDLSYFGQDQTSPSKPYVFWCNNNFDRWNNDYPFGTQEQDDMEGSGDLYTPGATVADSNYLNADGYRIIPDTRDLEDYSRLWLTGVDSNLLAALPAGSTVTLSWGDVGNPNSSNPTIDLFKAADGDGGIGYLTNSTTATEQTNLSQCPYAGRLAPGGSIQLNSPYFPVLWPGNHFIWCGVANGSGKLTLSFKDGNGNVLGQASIWIQIQDIKQMYERWTVGDDSAHPPATTAYLSQNGLVSGETAFQYGPATTNTPYILLVHGYNMAIWEKDAYAETAFKRFYWQGYQGRFGAFNWPTSAHWWEFGSDELQAWNSGLGLLNKLEDLDTQYPGKVYLAAHSLGNIVAGEALRLAGNSQIVNTYIAMQGAVTAHAYDPNTAIYHPAGDHGELDVYSNYWTNGAPCYFNASAGAETYVNFFNANDWALTNAWLLFQDQKINLAVGYLFGSDGYYYKDYGLLGASDRLFFPQDTYALFDKLFQCRSYALGMQINVGGSYKVGTAYNQVNLQNIWPPDIGGYRDHIWHSAEFRSDCPQRWQFWYQTLHQMGLK